MVPFIELGVNIFGDENQEFCYRYIPSELGIGHLRGQRMLKLSIQIRGKSTNLESHLPRMAFKAVELGRVLAVCCSKNPLKMLAASSHWLSKCAVQIVLLCLPPIEKTYPEGLEGTR